MKEGYYMAGRNKIKLVQLASPETNPLAKATVESVSDLILWLQTKPAKQEYRYVDNDKCAFAQYLSHKGFKNIIVGEADWCQILADNSCSPDYPIDPKFDALCHLGPYSVEHFDGPKTFERLLKNAIALKADLEVKESTSIMA